jgi:hypothetical protein
MKRIIIILLTISLVLLMGCGSSDVEVTGPENNNQQGGGSLIDTVTDAVTGFFYNEMECTYVQPEGQGTADYYFKNGKTRMDVKMSTGDEISYINDGEYMYLWADTPQEMSIMWDLDDLASYDTGSDTPDIATMDDPEEIEAYLKEQNADCKPSSVSDVLFIPPNRNFMDMGAMMANMPEMPAGYN